jgi:hypothetical protein
VYNFRNLKRKELKMNTYKSENYSVWITIAGSLLGVVLNGVLISLIPKNNEALQVLSIGLWIVNIVYYLASGLMVLISIIANSDERLPNLSWLDGLGLFATTVFGPYLILFALMGLCMYGFYDYGSNLRKKV